MLIWHLQPEHLQHPEFDHDQLLLNLAAWLTLEPELVALQCRQPVRRGLQHVSAGVKRRWRVATVAGPPLLLLGLVVALRRGCRQRQDC